MLELLCEQLTQEQASTYGLVLDAYRLPYATQKSPDGWEIWVDTTVHDRAQMLVAEYIAENEDQEQPDDLEARAYQRTYSGIGVSLFLLACMLAVNTSGNADQIIREFGASARDIIHGELYRTVTALMLHSNYAHLAGNMVGIAIFGTAVCSITGNGVGWLMILMTGMVGNLINAALFQYGHLSIGASTAVFGAIGILAAYQLARKIKIPGQRMKAWLPFTGGLALLGYLGVARHADITAHLFGFSVGIGCGLLYALYLYRLLQPRHQIYCLVAAIGTIVFSWSGVFLAAKL